jgi:hypothetical protein
MIVVASLNALTSVVLFVYTLIAATRLGNRIFVDEAGRMGDLLSFVVVPLVAALTVMAVPFVIFGAVHMSGLTNYRMAKAAAVLTLLPATSLLSVLGIPVGLWSLAVLRSPDVRNAFDERRRERERDRTPA